MPNYPALSVLIVWIMQTGSRLVIKIYIEVNRSAKPELNYYAMTNTSDSWSIYLILLF